MSALSLSRSRRSADHWQAHSTSYATAVRTAEEGRLETLVVASSTFELAAGESAHVLTVSMLGDSPLCECPCVVHAVVDSVHEDAAGAIFSAQFIKYGASPATQESSTRAGWSDDGSAPRRLVFRERVPALGSSDLGPALTGRREARLYMHNPRDDAVQIAEGATICRLLEIAPPAVCVASVSGETSEAEDTDAPSRVPIVGAASGGNVFRIEVGDFVLQTMVALAAFSVDSEGAVITPDIIAYRVACQMDSTGLGADFVQFGLIADGAGSFRSTRVTSSLVSASDVVLEMGPDEAGLAILTSTLASDGFAVLFAQGVIRLMATYASAAAPPFGTMFSLTGQDDRVARTDVVGSGTADASVSGSLLAAIDNTEGGAAVVLLSGTYVCASMFPGVDDAGGGALVPVPTHLPYELVVVATRFDSASPAFSVRFEDDFSEEHTILGAEDTTVLQFHDYDESTGELSFRSWQEVASNESASLVVRGKPGVAWRVVLPAGQAMSANDSVSVRFRTVLRTDLELPRNWPMSSHWKVVGLCEQMHDLRCDPDSAVGRTAYGHRRAVSLLSSASAYPLRLPLFMSTVAAFEMKHAFEGRVSICAMVREDVGISAVVPLGIDVWVEKRNGWEKFHVARGAGPVVMTESPGNALVARPRRVLFSVPSHLSYADVAATYSQIRFHEMVHILWMHPSELCLCDADSVALASAHSSLVWSAGEVEAGPVVVETASGQRLEMQLAASADEDQVIRVDLCVGCHPAAATVTLGGAEVGAEPGAPGGAYKVLGEDFSVASWASSFAPNLSVVVPRSAIAESGPVALRFAGLPNGTEVFACSVDTRWVLFRRFWNVVECTGRARALAVDATDEDQNPTTYLSVRTHNTDGNRFNYDGIERLCRLEIRNDKSIVRVPYAASVAMQAADITFNSIKHGMVATMERPDLLSPGISNLTDEYGAFESSPEPFSCDDATFVVRDNIPATGFLVEHIKYHGRVSETPEESDPSLVRGWRRACNMYYNGSAILNRFFGDGTEMVRVVGAAPGDPQVLRRGSGAAGNTYHDVGRILSPVTDHAALSYDTAAAAAPSSPFTIALFDARGQTDSLVGKGFTLVRLSAIAATGAPLQETIGTDAIDVTFDAQGRVVADVLAGLAAGAAAATLLFVPAGGGSFMGMALPASLGPRVFAFGAADVADAQVEFSSGGGGGGGEGGGGGDPHVAPVDGAPFELDRSVRAVRFLDTQAALASGARVVVNAAAEPLAREELAALVAATGLRAHDAMQMTFWSCFFVCVFRAGETEPAAALCVDAATLLPRFATGRVEDERRGPGRAAPAPAPLPASLRLSAPEPCALLPDYARGAGARCAGGAAGARRELLVCAGSHSETIAITLFADKSSHVRSAIRIRLPDCYALQERGAVGCFFSRRWARDIGAVDAVHAVAPLDDADGGARAGGAKRRRAR
jgi:hypothetical protein